MSVVAELEKLASLRASGVISDDEFENLKTELLAKGPHSTNSSAASMPWNEVKLPQKWWFQVLLTLFLTPLGLLIMAFSKSYFKKRDGSVARRSVLFKLVIAILALFVWAFSAVQMLETGGESILASSSNLPKCDSYETRGALADAIENSVSARTYNLRLLDVQEVVTIGDVGERSNELKCNAKLVLNNGKEFVGYTVRAGTDGMTLVTISEPFQQVQSGFSNEVGAEYIGDDVVTDDGTLIESASDEYSDELFVDEEATEEESIRLETRPALNPSELALLSDAIVQQGILTDRDWTIISSTKAKLDHAAILLETPRKGEGVADCHVCAPPLSLLVFSLQSEESPQLLVQDIDFEKDGIGSWGKTSSVQPITLPDSTPAFAFAYSSTFQGENVFACVVRPVEESAFAQDATASGLNYKCPD